MYVCLKHLSCLFRELYLCVVFAMYNHAPKTSTPRADEHILDRKGLLGKPLEAERTRSFLPSIL